MSRARRAYRAPKYPQASVRNEERSECPLAMVLWPDQWASDLVPYMTHAKEPFGARTELSEAIVNLLE